MSTSRKILVTPLDWGLGHATRCIPLIREFLLRNCEVVIAGSGPSLELLKLEFPALPYYTIPGYRPQYSSTGSMLLPMAMQLPKFLNTIRDEHREIERIVASEKIDYVASDNRYGAWSSEATSIFITHQLHIRVPGIFSGIVRKMNSRYIKEFAACWVPDYAGKDSLAGELSAARNFLVTHIGPLSRFKKQDVKGATYELVGLVSGPEPQRQMFEELLRRQLVQSNRKSLLVCGIPERKHATTTGCLDEVNHLRSDELNDAVAGAGVIISRPGYSTVMDLAVLNKQAIFIPTPGQTEQEYLGSRLMERKIAYCAGQKDFDLAQSLKAMESYAGFTDNGPNNLLKDAIDKLLK